jgi:ferredoxin
MAYVISEDCIACGSCISECPVDAISEGWQKIIDNLNDYNINVVTIGLTGKNYDLNVRLGKNLCGLDCQSNLSQTWHIINNSKGILTFDCGIYILAGTTNAQIFLIDTYIHPYWHTPFRNGSYNYKHTVIKGTCSEYCLSNLKYYSMQENILIQPLVQKCALNYSEFKCIPSVETVSNTVIKHFK